MTITTVSPPLLNCISAFPPFHTVLSGGGGTSMEKMVEIVNFLPRFHPLLSPSKDENVD